MEYIIAGALMGLVWGLLDWKIGSPFGCPHCAASKAKAEIAAAVAVLPAVPESGDQAAMQARPCE